MFNKLNTKIQNLSPDLRKIITNIFWLFADRILRMGMGLIVTAWLGRYLKPEGFGLFNYAIAFVSLFGPLTSLGLDQIIVRNIVRNPTSRDQTIGTAFALKFASSTAAFLLATAAISLLRPDDPLTLTLTALCAACMFFDAFNAIDLWFQSQIQSKYTVLARNTAFLIMTAVRVLLLLIQAPIVAFAWAGLVEVSLGAMGLVLTYKMSGQNLQKWRANFQLAKNLLKESLPLIFSDLAIMIYLRIDIVMLGQLADDRSVGLYSAATRVSEVWYFIATAIVRSVNPSIIAAKNVSDTQYYDKLQKLYNLMALLAYSIAIPLTFLSTNLVVLIFGKDYAQAGGILSVHIWAALFVFFGWAKGVWIVTEGRTGFALAATSSGAILNIILNFFLIPRYAGMGAAIATVISYALTDYLTCFIYPPARKLGVVMTKAITLSFLLKPKRS